MTASKRPRRAAEAPDPFAPPPAQPELTPAPVAANPNDEARKAIAVINTNLGEFDQVEAGLADLERRYKGVAYPVDTSKGMKEAVEARREIKGVRVKVEHTREAAKAPVLKLGRDIDAKAKAITARLEFIEKPIDDQIKAQERKEAQRVQALEIRLADIGRQPQQCIGADVPTIEGILEGLNALDLPSFEEYRERAAAAQHAATQQVKHLLQQAKDAAELAQVRERERRESERVETIQDRIGTLILDLLALATSARRSAHVARLIARLEAVVIEDAIYQEFAPKAREEKARVLAALAKRKEDLEAQEKAAEEAAAAPAAHASSVNHQPLTAAQAPSPPGLTDIVDDKLGHPKPGQASLQAAAYHAVAAGAAMPMAVVDAALARIHGPEGAPQTLPPTERSMEPPRRPSDAEIVRVLADHYDVQETVAAVWLRSFDHNAWVNQLPLVDAELANA